MGSPKTSFSLNWRERDLVGALFCAQGIGRMVSSQRPDGDRWVQTVSLGGLYWNQCGLISSSMTQTVGSSAPSTNLPTAPR